MSLPAQEGSVPVPKAPVRFRAPAFTVAEAAPGIRAVFCESSAAPLLHLQLASPTGARRDPPGREGLASLVAQLLLEGTERTDRREISRRLEPWGGSVMADAGWDLTWLSVTVLADGADEALGLLCELITEPAFRTPALERWRSHRSAELSRRAYTPSALADDILARLLFGPSPYGRSIKGTVPGLQAISSGDLESHHRRHLLGAGLVCTAVGSFCGEATLQQITEALAPLVTTGTEIQGSEVPIAPEGEGRGALVDLPAAAQTELRLGCSTVPLDHEDIVGLQLLSGILGKGFDSRLGRSLRERQGLAYSVFSHVEARRGASPWVLGSAVETTRAGEALDLIRQEIERLRREPVPEAELEGAKDFLIGLAQTSLKSGRALAGFLQHLVLHGLHTVVHDRYEKSIRDLDASRLQHLAQLYLTPSRLAVVAAGPADSLRPTMRERFPRGALSQLSRTESSLAEFRLGGAAAYSS